MDCYVVIKDFDGHKVGETVELEEAQAKALVAAGLIREPTEEDGDLMTKKVIAEFRDSLTNEIKILVRETVQGLVAELNVPTDGSGKIAIQTRERDEDDPKQGWKSMGYFAKAVRTDFDVKAGAVLGEDMKKYLARKDVTGLGENTGESAGILVPTEMATTIFRKAFPEDDLFALTDSRTVRGNSIKFKSVVENSRAAGQRYGGVQGYWVREGQQLTGSKPKYTDISLELEKLAVMVHATDELIDDSELLLEQELTTLASAEIKFLVSDAIVDGNGVGKPLGILQSAALVAPNRELANKISGVDVITMWARMHGPLRSAAIWLINQEVEPQLDQMFLAVKNVAGTENVGGWPVYLPPGAGLRPDAPGMLKGRPVKVIESCKALGTKGDIILWHPASYRTITKGGVKAAMSIHLRFDYDESVFRFTFRVDGQSMYASAITPFNGTNTVTNMVALDVPS